MHFTEANFENAIIELFREQLGYDYVYGPEVARDYTEPIYMEQLRAAVQELNPSLSAAAIEEAITKIRTYEGGSLVQKNEQFTDYLQNGVAVNYFDGREQRSLEARFELECRGGRKRDHRAQHEYAHHRNGGGDGRGGEQRKGVSPAPGFAAGKSSVLSMRTTRSMSATMLSQFFSRYESISPARTSSTRQPPWSCCYRTNFTPARSPRTDRNRAVRERKTGAGRARKPLGREERKGEPRGVGSSRGAGCRQSAGSRNGRASSTLASGTSFLASKPLIRRFFHAYNPHSP